MIDKIYDFINKHLKLTIFSLITFISACFLFTTYCPNMLIAIKIEEENPTGSYNMNVDIDKYYDINLLNTQDVQQQTTSSHVTWKIENNTFYVKGSNISNGQGPIFYTDLNLTFDAGTYTMAYIDLVFNDYQNKYLQVYLGTSEWDSSIVIDNYSGLTRYTTFTLNETKTFNYLRCWTQSNLVNVDYNFKLMIYKGNYQENISYSLPFRFGYNMELTPILKNITTSTITGTISANICNNENNICNTYTSSNISINSNQIFNNKVLDIYIPYLINNNGLVYFNYNISFSSTFTSSQLDTSLSDINPYFIPIFQATSKLTNDSTEYLYLKSTYIYNSVNLNNIQIKNNINNFRYVITDYSQATTTAINLSNNIPYLLSSYYTYNSMIIDNKLKVGNYFNGNIYKLTFIDKVYNNNTYTLCFDSFNLLVKNNTNTSAPISGNGVDPYDDYKTCSAWYDIPCQMGNAVTWTIYNVPILSDFFVLIKSFTTGLSALVTMIKWYEGFGIIFSVFVFIMLIRIIIMMLKGSNDDRGGK